MRLFFAVPIPDKIKEEISTLQEDLKIIKNYGIKWVKPSSMHITLKFLGEVDNAKLPELVNTISEGIINFHGTEAEVRGIGYFPNARRPRVIWIGLKESRLVLQSVANKIDELMTPLGFTPEKRPFKPHLTIGRFKDLSDIDNLVSSTDGKKDSTLGTFTISGVNLYQSTLKPSGAEYTVLHSFEL